MPEYLDTWSQSRRVGELSEEQLQQLKPTFMERLQTLISGQDPTKLARGVDISHWQQDVDVARMKREGPIHFGMPKSSDGKQVQAGDASYPPNYVDDWLYRNVQKFYDASVPCLPYHYVQPFFTGYTVQGTVDWNMTTLHAALDPLMPNKSYHGIVLDVEEKTASDYNGSDVVLKMMEQITLDPKLGTVPLIVYSSMSVLNYYTKLRDQISYPNANKNLWMAQWVFNTATTTTWADLINRILPTISMKVLTPGYAGWKFLQWSASFTLPGCAGRMDQNLYNGTPEQLNTWLGYSSTVPPVEPPTDDPELEQRVAKLESDLAELRENLHNV